MALLLSEDTTAVASTPAANLRALLYLGRRGLPGQPQATGGGHVSAGVGAAVRTARSGRGPLADPAWRRPGRVVARAAARAGQPEPGRAGGRPASHGRGGPGTGDPGGAPAQGDRHHALGGPPSRPGRKVLGALLATPRTWARRVPPEYPSLAALPSTAGCHPGAVTIPEHRCGEQQRCAGAPGSGARARRRAGASRWHDLGAVGHLNPASGYGEWPQAELFIDRTQNHGGTR